jgi:hypothetical protein
MARLRTDRSHPDCRSYARHYLHYYGARGMSLSCSNSTVLDTISFSECIVDIRKYEYALSQACNYIGDVIVVVALEHFPWSHKYNPA